MKLFGYNPCMLNRLYISNIVLIEKLDLEFSLGLNVLTGETGAGKSILLDALSLALGARSDIGLIRHGCDMAQVIAEFDFANATLKQILTENGIDSNGALVLRRTITTDGKSRAWVNDIPVSIKILNQVGNGLVEIHGQFENHSLLDQTTHRKTLDEFAMVRQPGYAELLTCVKDSYTELHAAEKRLRELEDLLEKSAAERDFLEHNVSELSALRPQVGEEDELSTKRSTMMSSEKNAAILSEAVGTLTQKGQGLDAQIFSAAHILERIKTDPNPYQEQINRLYDAASTLAEISDSLVPSDKTTDNIDDIEERLFAIRAVARKHRVSADELPEKLAQMTEQLNSIDNSDTEMQKLKNTVQAKKSVFNNVASKLTQERIAASNLLRTCLLSELPDLKLGQADFMVERTAGAQCAAGADEITFLIKTNPGSPFAPLHKTASGGELSRLMLALRVVLINGDNARVFVFDELDTGISGATASAVGQRLERLAADGQALVITHSAQVAGFADRHFKIEKHADKDTTITTVVEISNDDQIHEIARIISGAEITNESIATAKTLLKKH